MKEVAVFRRRVGGLLPARHRDCSIRDSTRGALRTGAEGKARRTVRVRGYISCVLGCPYDGDVDPRQVAWVAREPADGLLRKCPWAMYFIGVGTPVPPAGWIEAVAARGSPRAPRRFPRHLRVALANIYVPACWKASRYSTARWPASAVVPTPWRHRQRRQRRRPLPAERPGDPYRGRHAPWSTPASAHLRGARQEQRIASGEGVLLAKA